MRSMVLTMLVFVIAFVIGVAIVGGVFLGDVDDNWWWQGAVLGLPSLFLYPVLRGTRIKRTVRRWASIVLGGVFVVMLVYAAFGIVTGRSILDGHKYVEMEGLAAFIVGILSIIPLCLWMGLLL